MIPKCGMIHVHFEACANVGPFVQGCLDGAKIAASETACGEVCTIANLFVIRSLNDKRERGCLLKLVDFSAALNLVIGRWSRSCLFHAAKGTF